MIEHPEFNPILFIPECGHDYMYDHFTPFYLSLPHVHVEVIENH